MIKGFDLDGTLIAYEQGYVLNDKINYSLIDQVIHAGDRIAILTNQGGISLGYRTVGHFIERFDVVRRYIEEGRGAKVVELQACVFHEKARTDQRGTAYMDLIAALYPLQRRDREFNFLCWMTQEYRKPEPRMLQIAGVRIYYGDSDEDERAAKAAGIPFVRVPRLV